MCTIGWVFVSVPLIRQCNGYFFRTVNHVVFMYTCQSGVSEAEIVMNVTKESGPSIMTLQIDRYVLNVIVWHCRLWLAEMAPSRSDMRQVQWGIYCIFPPGSPCFPPRSPHLFSVILHRAPFCLFQAFLRCRTRTSHCIVLSHLAAPIVSTSPALHCLDAPKHDYYAHLHWW